MFMIITLSYVSTYEIEFLTAAKMFVLVCWVVTPYGTH
jgi:hypothetical protein